MKLNVNDLPNQILTKLQALSRYRVIIFVVFVIGLYSYVVIQINAATNAQPSVITAAAKAKATPRIDPVVVAQLRQLQDNSVSVKALVNDARTNPFQ